MKFKYYLRGLGIGILISTIILSISFAMKKNDLSDDEIIARAKELGMVMEDTGKDKQKMRFQRARKAVLIQNRQICSREQLIQGRYRRM